MTRSFFKTGFLLEFMRACVYQLNQGEKMLNIRGIDHINMNVANLNKSIAFYQEVLGLDVKEREFSQRSGREYAIIGKSGKAFFVLCEGEAARSPGRLNHFGINVENFDEALSLIKKLDLEVGPYGDADGVVDYPLSKSVYIYDPDGNEIELSSKFGGGL